MSYLNLIVVGLALTAGIVAFVSSTPRGWPLWPAVLFLALALIMVVLL